MRTTNILLVFIVLFLFLHLFKDTGMSIINKASAQTNRMSPSTKKDTLLVKIVDIGNISGALPVIYGNSYSGYVLPVDYGHQIDAYSRQTKLLPVVISQPK